MLAVLNTAALLCGVEHERTNERHQCDRMERALGGVLRGHCGVTDPRVSADFDPNCCGTIGSFTPPPYIGRRALPAWCVERCQGCPRCRWVSFSIQHWDCSWYAHCDPAKLTQFADFETVSVGSHPLHQHRCSGLGAGAARDANASSAELSPARCRGLKGNNVETLGKMLCRDFAPSLPPDRHARTAFAAMAAAHQPLYRLPDLARLLAGKRLALLGDSVTFQFAQALQCAAQGEFRDELTPWTLTVDTPLLHRRCTALWIKYLGGLGMRTEKTEVDPGAATDRCQCSVTDHESWVDSTCQLLGVPPTPTKGEASRKALRLDRRSFHLHGTHVPAHNFTFFGPFGAGGRIASTEECLVCTPGRGDTSCAKVDACASARLQSNIQLLHAADAADVVVFNIGQHYHNRKEYRAAVKQALRELAAFSQRPGAAAAFLETSWTHFAVPSGDFDQFVATVPSQAQDATLTGAGHHWQGPSACHPASLDAKPQWRNAIVRELLDTQPRLARRVALIPFGERTKPRWDLHGHTR